MEGGDLIERFKAHFGNSAIFRWNPHASNIFERQSTGL